MPVIGMESCQTTKFAVGDAKFNSLIGVMGLFCGLPSQTGALDSSTVVVAGSSLYPVLNLGRKVSLGRRL